MSTVKSMHQSLIYKYAILIFLIIFSLPGIAQNEKDRVRKTKKEDKVFNVIPLIFSSPETDLAFGGFGVFQKHLFGNDPTYRKSVIQLGATYTLNNQLFIFSQPDIFFKNEKFRLRANFLYNQRKDLFWGVGNNTPEANEEDVEFNQFSFTPIFYFSPRKNLFVGLQYRYANEFSLKTLEDGLLEQAGDQLGANGAISSGAGLALLYDNRKNQVNPVNG